MELIQISSSKLKIMLSSEDMQKYALDAKAADYDDTATRRAFWSILDDVKIQTGFNAAGDRVFIQLYPLREGGCEMFVTKMGLLCCDADEKSKKGSRQGAKNSRTLADRLGTDHGDECVKAFVFDELSSLLAVCRRLYSRKWRGNSEAYKGTGDKYYLILGERASSMPNAPDRLCFISEYGRAENADVVRLYIREHATSICCERAVQTLGVL